MIIGNQIVKVKRGQLLTGRVTLSRQIGEQQNKVERILKVFENAHQIEQQTTNKYRLITIVNYDLYQDNGQQIGQQMNNKRTTDEQQMNTNNKVNKVNKVNKENREGQRSPLEIFAEEIFIHWNKQNIIVHKSLSKEARAEIRRAFKEGYDARDVKGMITLYATILHGEEYLWSYKWNLYEFLKRGLQKFEGKTVDDYRKDTEKQPEVIKI